ncbi:hypothetical protein HDU97_005823 [Phlyctochytrium planicorne]|nr:hypothetical protein HDU97_005823 [Phlyctochytrium planicorne]
MFKKANSNNTTAIQLSALSEFGFTLFQSLIDQNTDDASSDIVISPLSLWIALALTTAGARTETLQNLAKALNLAPNTPSIQTESKKLLDACSQLQQTDLEFTISNAIAAVTSAPLSPQFLSLAKDGFGSMLFESRDAIDIKQVNDWVSNQTKNKIPKLLNDDVEADVILLNAIYLKAKWQYPFSKNATSPANFHPLSSPETPIQCNMMNLKKQFSYLATPEFQSIRLPYQSQTKQALSAIIILPTPETTIHSLPPQIWSTHLPTLLKSPTQLINLHLPKFKIEATAKNLKPSLQSIGMSIAFSKDADFSGMLSTGEKELFISDVVHKVFIDVDEDGTEAAAATAVLMLRSAMRPMVEEVVEMRVDRPFWFLIVNEARLDVLFLARVASVPAI